MSWKIPESTYTSVNVIFIYLSMSYLYICQCHIYISVNVIFIYLSMSYWYICQCHIYISVNVIFIYLSMSYLYICQCHIYISVNVIFIHLSMSYLYICHHIRHCYASFTVETQNPDQCWSNDIKSVVQSNSPFHYDIKILFALIIPKIKNWMSESNLNKQKPCLCVSCLRRLNNAFCIQYCALFVFNIV